MFWLVFAFPMLPHSFTWAEFPINGIDSVGGFVDLDMVMIQKVVSCMIDRGYG
jgi:hypothetical protein